MFDDDNEKFDELLSHHAYNGTLELIEMEDEEVMLMHPSDGHAIVSGFIAAIKLVGFIGISTPQPG
jgi:hypothetical protein